MSTTDPTNNDTAAEDASAITDEDDDLQLPWGDSGRAIPRLLRPLQDFLATEVSGAILVLIGAVVALVWANLDAAAYESFWAQHVGLTFGDTALLDLSLRHWVNDVAMTLFFFVVGLEIKREVTSGELREPRAVALPVLAAVGGMVVPAAFYLALNAGGAGASGWGVPMATDIAFALAVLTIAGRGLPSKLRSFLLTLAIADDIGAILVIAIFYSAGIGPVWLLLAAGCLGLMILASRLHIRWMAVYVCLGIIIWLATFEAGVHPTIAGVVLGVAAPAVAFQRPRAVSAEARRVADATSDSPEPPDADAQEWIRLSDLSREAVSPLARLEHRLHPWSSYLVVPLFALANAGVVIRPGEMGRAVTSPVFLGIVAGLVLGKVIGVAGATFLGARLGLAELPGSRVAVLGVAAVAGIGFTVSLFVTELAFDDPPLTRAAKLGVLVASLLAGILGSILLGRARARGARARVVPKVGAEAG